MILGEKKSKFVSSLFYISKVTITGNKMKSGFNEIGFDNQKYRHYFEKKIKFKSIHQQNDEIHFFYESIDQDENGNWQ